MGVIVGHEMKKDERMIKLGVILGQEQAIKKAIKDGPNPGWYHVCTKNESEECMAKVTERHMLAAHTSIAQLLILNTMGQ